MTNSELLAEVEALQQELEEHRCSWGQSLDETLPDLPQTNIAELREQCRSLSRRLGAIQPYLRTIRPSWAMGASGVTWDALEEAVRAEQTAAIKGPSLDAVIEALDQVIGQLQRQPPTAEVLLADQPRNTDSPGGGAGEPAERTILQRYKSLGPFEKFGVWAGVASILGLLIGVATLHPSYQDLFRPILNYFEQPKSAGFQKEPVLQAKLLLRIGGFRVYVLNSGPAPATGVYVDVVAWRPGAPGPDVERTFPVRDLAPNADFTFDVSFRNPHLDPNSRDTLPTGGYIAVSSINVVRPRAWAFHVPNEDDSETHRRFFEVDPWPVVEFQYPENKPYMGSCVDYPIGVCHSSVWVWNPKASVSHSR